MQPRPIREIVNPQALRPASHGAVVRERRTRDRFGCRLPAVLLTEGREFPIECLEISEGGMRVSTQRSFHLKPGQQVEVRIRIGPNHFADRFTAIQMARNPQGFLSIHLRLQARTEPAPAP